MRKKQIPDKVKIKALNTVLRYNNENNTHYSLRFRGDLAYLDRANKYGNTTKIGRMRYDAKTAYWEFDVFKYSRERYDPDEWMFPGCELLDGTIEGVLIAGHEIYPEDEFTPKITIGGCLLIVFVAPFLLVWTFLKWIFHSLTRPFR